MAAASTGSSPQTEWSKDIFLVDGRCWREGCEKLRDILELGGFTTYKQPIDGAEIVCGVLPEIRKFLRLPEGLPVKNEFACALISDEQAETPTSRREGDGEAVVVRTKEAHQRLLRSGFLHVEWLDRHPKAWWATVTNRSPREVETLKKEEELNEQLKHCGVIIRGYDYKRQNVYTNAGRSFGYSSEGNVQQVDKVFRLDTLGMGLAIRILDAFLKPYEEVQNIVVLSADPSLTETFRYVARDFINEVGWMESSEGAQRRKKHLYILSILPSQFPPEIRTLGCEKNVTVASLYDEKKIGENHIDVERKREAILPSLLAALEGKGAVGEFERRQGGVSAQQSAALLPDKASERLKEAVGQVPGVSLGEDPYLVRLLESLQRHAYYGQKIPFIIASSYPIHVQASLPHSIFDGSLLVGLNDKKELTELPTPLPPGERKRGVVACNLSEDEQLEILRAARNEGGRHANFKAPAFGVPEELKAFFEKFSTQKTLIATSKERMHFRADPDCFRSMQFYVDSGGAAERGAGGRPRREWVLVVRARDAHVYEQYTEVIAAAEDPQTLVEEEAQREYRQNERKREREGQRVPARRRGARVREHREGEGEQRERRKDHPRPEGNAERREDRARAEILPPNQERRLDGERGKEAGVRERERRGQDREGEGEASRQNRARAEILPPNQERRVDGERGKEAGVRERERRGRDREGEGEASRQNRARAEILPPNRKERAVDRERLRDPAPLDRERRGRDRERERDLVRESRARAETLPPPEERGMQRERVREAAPELHRERGEQDRERVREGARQVRARVEETSSSHQEKRKRQDKEKRREAVAQDQERESRQERQRKEKEHVRETRGQKREEVLPQDRERRREMEGERKREDRQARNEAGPHDPERRGESRGKRGEGREKKRLDALERERERRTGEDCEPQLEGRKDRDQPQSSERKPARRGRENLPLAKEQQKKSARDAALRAPKGTNRSSDAEERRSALQDSDSECQFCPLAAALASRDRGLRQPAPPPPRAAAPFDFRGHVPEESRGGKDRRREGETSRERERERGNGGARGDNPSSSSQLHKRRDERSEPQEKRGRGRVQTEARRGGTRSRSGCRSESSDSLWY